MSQRRVGVVGVRRARGHPHVLLERVGLLGLDVRGAVLEPEQVARGRAARCSSTRCGRSPSWVQRIVAVPNAAPGQVADRVHGDLRVVGARLHHEVAVAAGGVEVVGREVRERRRAPPGSRSARPNRSSPGVPSGAGGADEQRPPEAERDRQARGRQVGGLAGVVRRCVVRARRRAERPGRQPLGQPRGDRGPRPQQLDQLVARGRREVERGEVEPVLRGRHDAGLVRARERVGARRRPPCGGRRRRRRRAARRRGRRRRRDRRPARRPGPSEGAPRTGAVGRVAGSVRAGPWGRTRHGCGRGPVSGR